MKQFISILLFTAFLILLGSNFSYSQKRRIYRGGEGPPARSLKKDTIITEPQKVHEKRGPQKKICNCKDDLEIDPTSQLAYSQTGKGKKPFTGSCATFYDDNQLEMQITYINGKEDGPLYKFYDDGVKWLHLNYAQGKPHGKWQFWEKDSTLMWENNYSFGNKH